MITNDQFFLSLIVRLDAQATILEALTNALAELTAAHQACFAVHEKLLRKLIEDDDESERWKGSEG